MAESLAEKLKRIAREKREAQEKLAAAAVVVEAEVANDQPKVVEAKEEVSDDNSEHASRVKEETCLSTRAVEYSGGADGNSKADDNCTGCEDSGIAATELTTSGAVIEVDGTVNLSGPHQTVLQPTPSSHPLAMQFAELEAALLTADPTFKTTLRDVHRHLGKDPELVTLMTEEEVAMIVKGLVVFANAEVVEPAKAKAVKAASRALKNISADDL